MLIEFEGQLGDGGWREDVGQGAGGDVGRFGLGRYYLFLVEGIVRVYVGVGEDGGEGGFYARVADDDFGFARIADGGIYDGQDNVFVVQRGGTF